MNKIYINLYKKYKNNQRIKYHKSITNNIKYKYKNNKK